ncbi:MAG: hypothetical protein KAG64_01465 [Bacteroidales bacterium]|nr:hypothetical protein [Bacteroidales bacterium]
MSWEIYSDWEWFENDSNDWSSFGQLNSLFKAAINKRNEEYLLLLEQWNQKLSYLGGDPTNSDWSSFRPLRLAREEDWADWLAYLIEKSSTGYFAESVFKIEGFQQNDYAKPAKVLREVSDITSGYRADIIIEWNKIKQTHFEIKIGDPNLLKTFQASESFQKCFNVSDNDWSNYILLLPNQVSDWLRIIELNDTNQQVSYLTWKQITITLRQSLFKDENIVWKVWAYSFIGIIEQKLLGFDNYWNLSRMPVNISDKIEILKKSLEL